MAITRAGPNEHLSVARRVLENWSGLTGGGKLAGSPDAGTRTAASS